MEVSNSNISINSNVMNENRQNKKAFVIKTLTNLRKETNAEPIIFLLSITYGIFLSVSPLSLFYTRCVEIFINEKNVTKFCADTNSKNNTDLLKQIEIDISNMSIYIQICSTLTTFISAPIIGTYSDLHGRKKTQIFCIIAMSIYTFCQILGLLMYEKTNIYFFIFGAEILLGTMGGLAMSSIIANAIIVDDCRNTLKKKNSGVPLRIAITCVLRTLGNILGSLVYIFSAAPLIISSQKYINRFIQSYLIGLSCCLLALLYTIFFLRETYKITDSNSPLINTSFFECFKNYLMLTFKVVSIPRIGWTRLCLWLVLGFMLVDFINLDNNLQLMIYKRFPFNWSDETFINYINLRFIVISIGTFFCPYIIQFSNFVGKESLLLMLAFLANSINLLIIAVVQSTFYIFLALILFFFGSCTLSAFPTILSKMVKKKETARLFSVISLLFVLCPLISKSLFYKLYEITFFIYPRIVFLLMSIIIFLTFIGQIFVHYLMYPVWTSISEENNEQNINDTNSDCINFNTEDQEPLI